MHSLPRSSLNPFQMIYAKILPNILFSKYFCANFNLPCTLSQGLLSTLFRWFMQIFNQTFCSQNIFVQISIYHALSPKVFSQLFPVALRIYTTRYFCVQISFREYQLIMHSTPRPSLNFPRFFLRIFSKICWCKYCFANTDLSCTQPQGLLSTFPDAFCEYFTKYVVANIIL